MRNKIIIFIIIVLSIILIPKVKASEMYFGINGVIHVYNGNNYYIKIDGSNNNIPKTLYPSVGQDMNLGVIEMYFSPASGNINVLDTFNYNYLIFDTCATGNMNFVISNSSCGSSCVATGTYQRVTAGTCTVDGYSGYRAIYQIPIQKWYLNEISEMLEVSSYIHLVNNLAFAPRIRINSVFLSDEDYTLVYQNQQELINKLDSVNTTITNMQNSINSNIDSESTAIQNKIDAAKNQAHQDAQTAHNDAVNTQNTIKDDSVDSPNTSINTIKGSLASNGVITSLVVLPVTLYQSILNSVNGTCNTFSLGSLYGTNLTIPCINVSNYLGATLWGSIDVIISGIFIYMISRKMVKVFHQLSSLKEGDVLDG